MGAQCGLAALLDCRWAQSMNNVFIYSGEIIKVKTSTKIVYSPKTWKFDSLIPMFMFTFSLHP